MKLQHLRIKNFRGFNKEQKIDLSGRVLLFYGLNGRGKSSVFSALDMVLFPKEYIAEIRTDFGNCALTNRFNESTIGEIELAVERDGPRTSVITQPVSDSPQELKLRLSDVQRLVAGQRHRMLFTQRLLRDLMLGHPRLKFDRLNEMLGCDGYGQMMIELWRWGRVKIGELRDLQYVEARLKEATQGLRMIIDNGRELDSPITAMLVHDWVNLDAHQASDLICNAMRDRDGEIFYHLWGNGDHQSENVVDMLAERARVLYHAVNGLMGMPRRMRQAWLREHIDQIPVPWIERLFGLAADDLSTDSSGTHGFMVSEGLTHIDSDNDPLTARKLVFRSRRFFRMARNYARVASWLTKHRELAEQARRLNITDVDAAAVQIEHRERVLNLVRCIIDALRELTRAELSKRVTMLRPLWNRYYGQISSHAHFQTLDVRHLHDVRRESPDVSEYFFYPLSTGASLHFVVRDPDDKKSGDKDLVMESILSEGQLNCAIVSLALSLSELGSPPLKVIALDDPFVSWDDVNTENFFAAARDLALDGWTILLSTCDNDVVSSFEKNMETLPQQCPAMVYTFRDWTKDRGPDISTEAVRQRPRKDLKDLFRTGLQAVEVVVPADAPSD